MVFTVTLNPALDYVIGVDGLKTGDVNRATFEELHYGGKGINVSVMLTRLGIPNKALGFIAGFNGERLEEMVKSEGVDCRFVRLEGGDTRINVKIKAGKELDINARGPQVKKEDVKKLTDCMSDIKTGDYLVLSGSAPEGLTPDVYGDILAVFSDRGINFAVDAEGDLLLNTLKYKPFLIKPNKSELGALFGKEIRNDGEAVEYANRLKELGARNVLVSKGAEGAILADEAGGITTVGAVTGETVSTVGSGDSMLAGFLAGYIETGDYKYALRLGAACGNATAFCKDLADGFAVRDMFDRLPDVRPAFT